MNQFVRTVITGSPRTVACQVKRCAATWPGWIGPIGESIGSVATATSCFEIFLSSSAKPSASATMSIDCRKPPPITASIGLFAACSGVLPNSISSPTTSGAP